VGRDVGAALLVRSAEGDDLVEAGEGAVAAGFDEAGHQGAVRVPILILTN
jgi:hypothetical protein